MIPSYQANGQRCFSGKEFFGSDVLILLMAPKEMAENQPMIAQLSG
jgi:hypothetical protein